ncbi:MAG TPA: prolyl oligopeptidase family serine peptidase [Candidatus Udaeobacter sp.]|nr:prolyl oligopeptidase family serine peptidase [Candidatus Udaeobacter sp.]
MRKVNFALVLLLGVLGLASACSIHPVQSTASTAATGKPPDKIFHFKGNREINLTAYLEGWPYTAPIVDIGCGAMFYKLKGEQERLMMVKFDPRSEERVDFSKGRIISPRDFAKRNFGGAFCNPQRPGEIIMLADQVNDENKVLYALDLKTGEERKITGEGVYYVYGLTVSPDRRSLVYTGRSAKDEASSGAIYILDLSNYSERVVYRDSPPSMKLTWGGPAWRPDGKALVVQFVANSDRQRNNLIYIPLDGSGEPRVLSDTSKKRIDMYPLNEWPDASHFLFATDEDTDETLVYAYDLTSGKTRLVSPPGKNMKDAIAIRQPSGKVYVIGLEGNPLRTSLMSIDWTNGKVVDSKEFAGTVTIDDYGGSRIGFYTSALDDPFTQREAVITDGQIKVFDRGGYPPELLNQLRQCTYQKVSFDASDSKSENRPEVEGEKNGQLHAYLLSPKNPQTGANKKGMVLSFYGGFNRWNTYFQILCAAGYYVMSPAPRGTTDFGIKFQTMGYGDLGGMETLDALKAGKWLANYLKVPNKQIGVFGGSRGGYDTLRALTFPGQVDGITESFQFGFGWSDFGISDLINALKNGNIRLWYKDLMKFADLDKDPDKWPKEIIDKWNDRSPINHIDLLSVPLFLDAGGSDNRVPTDETLNFCYKAIAMGKQVVCLILPGEGHGYKTPGQYKYLPALLKWLESLD